MELIGKCSCVHCKEVKSIKGIHTHVDRTHLGSTKYSSGRHNSYDKQEYKDKLRISNSRKCGDFKHFNVICHKCGNNFYVKEREHLFPQKEKYFCDRRCANSRIVTKEHRKRISESLTGEPYKEEHLKTSICGWCDNKFDYLTRGKIKRFCSRSCSAKFTAKERRIKTRNKRTAFQNYRIDCKFRFSLNEYPSEFDFSLIEQHGWYLPTNRGNNLKGVSRDHMVSVKYGFENNIDPRIISHPANCNLIRHSENSSKRSKCSISLEELMRRIAVWDLKYSTIE